MCGLTFSYMAYIIQSSRFRQRYWLPGRIIRLERYSMLVCPFCKMQVEGREMGNTVAVALRYCGDGWQLIPFVMDHLGRLATSAMHSHVS